MAKKIDLEGFIGTKIGQLEVIEYSHSTRAKSDDRMVYHYKCKCVCGTEEIHPKYSLLMSFRGKRGTCCLNCRKNKLAEWSRNHGVKYTDPVEGKCSILHSNYRSRAKRKKIPFTFTFEEFKGMVTSNCYYCNLEPNKCRADRAKSRMGSSRVFFNGIDRLDSDGGYTPENTVPCCEDCNKAKRNLSYSQFIELIKRIYEYRIETQVNSLRDTRDIQRTIS